MESGFVVLPDTAATAVVQTVLPWRDPQVYFHASGRPWLVGEWPLDTVTAAAAGPVRVAVIGICPVTADRLQHLVNGVRALADVDALAAALPGMAHVVASIDGQIRVQGSVTGLRRVFHTRFRGVDLAADRAELLAVMTGAAVDEQALAVRMACGHLLPAPLTERPMWRGITALPPDRYLILTPAGARTRCWWQPPAPVQPLAEGARTVRAALTEAMHRRHPDSGRLSADLSGGMDSTSLCFLAAQHTPNLLTYRHSESETGNDDAVFAARAIRALDQAEHLVAAPDELPLLFADPGRVVDTEEPCPYFRGIVRLRHLVDLLTERGSRWHLAGHGGDELFSALPGYLHRLLWRHPVTAARHVRGYQALRRWPWRATLAGLLRPGSVASWWHAQAAHLTQPRPSSRQPVLGWGLMALHAQPWITPAAADSARQALRTTAERAQPLADDLGQHQLLLLLRTNAAHYRLLARVFTDAGIRLDMPYCDDRLAEAVLAVRPQDRASPWRYKPLLVEAMRGIVPDTILGRSTKGEFSQDSRVGFRANRAAILEMFADSLLAERDLLDRDALRACLAAPQQNALVYQTLEVLINCETWLRAATSAPWRTDAATASS